jgi:hypothetical protein
VHRKKNDGCERSSFGNVCGKHTCEEMTDSAESKEEGSNGYMGSVEPSSNEKNRTVNVFASRKLNTILVLVGLAEKKSNA